MQRATTVVAVIVLAALLVVQAGAIIWRADREPDADEVEYLHVAWLMAHGKQLYKSFFEHHTPFLFAAFQTLATDDVRAFFVRARLLSGAFGFAALLAFATIFWRVRREAVPIAVALIFASAPMWSNGLTAARAEPFAFAFFWWGAALVLLARRDDLRGVGLALVAIAALWNPKWPLCSIVVAAFWFFTTRRRLLSAAVALAITAIAVFILNLFAPLEQIWFFCIEFNRALGPWVARGRGAWSEDFHGKRLFFFAPLLLGPFVMLGAFLVNAAAIAFARVREKQITLFFLAMAVAAVLEVRFLYSWPLIWNYYYLMWGFVAAALVGLIPAAVEALLAAARVRYAETIGVAVTAVAMVLAVANVISIAPVEKVPGPYWVSFRYMEKRLRPGDRVWMADLGRHPVAVEDGDYYWWGFVIPVAEELRKTPRGARLLPPVGEKPFCAMTRGETTSLRFVSGPQMIRSSEQEVQCFVQLFREGRIRRMPFRGLWEIVR